MIKDLSIKYNNSKVFIFFSFSYIRCSVQTATLTYLFSTIAAARGRGEEYSSRSSKVCVVRKREEHWQEIK